MRIILSPAKKMQVDTDSFPVESLPQFLPEAERLKRALQEMSPQATLLLLIQLPAMSRGREKHFIIYLTGGRCNGEKTF